MEMVELGYDSRERRMRFQTAPARVLFGVLHKNVSITRQKRNHTWLSDSLRQKKAPEEMTAFFSASQTISQSKTISACQSFVNGYI